MVKVVIEVPDGSHLQLLADALAEAATMRTRAAGRAARDVQSDRAIADKRPDAARLLSVIADADWIRSVAEALPLLVLDESAPAPVSAPAANGGPAAAAASPLAEAVRAAGGAAVPDMTEAQKAALRALTVPPGARLTPGAPPVTIDGPPQALAEAAARRAAEESLVDIAEFGD